MNFLKYYLLLGECRFCQLPASLSQSLTVGLRVVCVQAGELLLAPPLRSVPPLLPARLATGGSPTTELLFGTLPQVTGESEAGAWQVR